MQGCESEDLATVSTATRRWSARVALLRHPHAQEARPFTLIQICELRDARSRSGIRLAATRFACWTVTRDPRRGQAQGSADPVGCDPELGSSRSMSARRGALLGTEIAVARDKAAEFGAGVLEPSERAHGGRDVGGVRRGLGDTSSMSASSLAMRAATRAGDEAPIRLAATRSGCRRALPVATRYRGPGLGRAGP